MNINLKPHPFLAHFVPGCFTALIVIMAHYNWSAMELNLASGNIKYPAAFALVVCLLMLGECIDAARDIFEHILDSRKGWGIKWRQFLVAGKEESLYVFENYYFTYYVFCANSFVAALVAVVGCQIDAHLQARTCKIFVSVFLMTIVFLVDAALLRDELTGFINTSIKRNSTHGE